MRNTLDKSRKNSNFFDYDNNTMSPPYKIVISLADEMYVDISNIVDKNDCTFVLHVNIVYISIQ